MKKVFGLFILLVVLAACSPGTRTVPGAKPVFYDGPRDQVFSTVVESISTSPGLDNSNGWIIVENDSAGGFVRAQTTVSDRSLFSSSTRDEALSVIVSAVGNERSQVIIQGTPGASPLADRLMRHLAQRFGEP